MKGSWRRTVAWCGLVVAWSWATGSVQPAVGLAAPEERKVDGDAQQEAYVGELRDVYEQFSRGDVEKMVARLYPSGQLKASAGYANMKAQIEQIHGRLGEYYGYEVVTVRRASERLHEVRAVLYFEHSPIVITLRLYRPHETWRFYSGVQWTADPSQMFAVDGKMGTAKPAERENRDPLAR